jgi:pimeloyl-ACP methyl ester carboxylesterase
MLFNPLGRQRDLTQPTLVMQGTADQVVDPSNADVLADLLPNAGVELLDGAGHLLYWEQPRRFARMVAGFLTDPAASARQATWSGRRAS